MRFPLRFVPSSATVPILQGPARGSMWIVGSGNHGFWMGSYEYHKRRRIELDVLPGMVFYDIGAHVGYYTLLTSALVGSEGSVYAFEPSPRNLRFLHHHVRLNDLSNVKIIEACVAKRSGRRTFAPGSDSFRGHLAPDGELEIRSVAIDPLVAAARIRPPDVVKIDVEGGEVEVLEGARETLQKHGPDIFLATHGARLEERCVRILGELDYRIRQPWENEIVARR